MKLILSVSSFLILFTSVIVAQPTLSLTDVGHQIGDVILLDSIEYQDITPLLGEDVTWDFNTLEGYGYVLQMETFDPTGFPGSELFPNSNILRRVIFQGVDFYQYLISSSIQMEYAGNYLEVGDFETQTVHSNPEVFLRTPITYGSTYSDTYQHELTSTFGTSFTSGYTESEAVAYGTLLMNDEEYTDAIVMRTQRWDTLVTTLQAGDVITYSYDDIYSFIRADFHFPLLTYGTHTVQTDGEEPTTRNDGSILLLQSIAGVKELETVVQKIDLYPNPSAEGKAFVMFDLKAPDNIYADLYDTQGRLVSNLSGQMPYSQGKNSILLNLPTDLQSGIYVVKVTGEEWTTSEFLRVE